jgi:ferredoxin-type protein NapF
MPLMSHSNDPDSPLPNAFQNARRNFLRGNFRECTAKPQSVAQLVVFEEHCLALQGVVCQTCADRCEVSAIQFAPQLGSVAIPVLISERCTGCGDCRTDCPTQAVQFVLR